MTSSELRIQNMAEAAVENSGQPKFYCHQCSAEIKPNLPEYTCPRCDNGFIEEITEDLNSASSSNPTPRQEPDPATQFADLWSRAFFDSFRQHAGEPDEGVSWARDRDSDDEEEEGNARNRRRTYTPARVAFRRTRPIRNQYLQGLFQYFVDRIGEGGGGGGGGGLPGLQFITNSVPIHGNPDDYAWGAGGLDTIISQLLNQLEGSGAPPAAPEKIDSLPVVKVTQEQTDLVLQCSVCMDDFKLDEEVRKLPCEHHYHTDCIVPWLKMHGTCPVCRKDLNGEDCTMKDEMITPISDDSQDSPSSNSNSSEDLT